MPKSAECSAIEHINCDAVTKPLPLYTNATIHNGIVYASAVQGFIPGTFDFPSDDPGDQARQVLRNLKTVLEYSGASLESVIRFTMFMTNTNDFGKINDAINEAFPQSPPARSSIVVAELPRHAKVVIEAMAAVIGD
jgi:2-iminobutanoate/2-iminopropanoate deaminase